MSFERFTERAKKMMELANAEAKTLNHEYVGTEHILLGLMKENTGMGATVLTNMGVNFKQIKTAIKNKIDKGTPKNTIGELPNTPRAKRVIELAIEEARIMQCNFVGTEHILLGLIREEEGIAAEVLKELGVNPSQVIEEIYNLLGIDDDIEKVGVSASPSSTSSKNIVKTFTRDLTILAREGKLDPTIGREKEIKRLITVLSRRTKNNPVLIGEAGVGKTAIAEGLASRIADGNVPKALKKCSIMAVDMSAMVAGTKYRGQFEERMQQLLASIKKDKNIILFIDELHTVVGAGGAEGGLDASNAMKPALSRGELRCIGATTLDEYRKYVEKDAALERRFQQIIVDEPTNEETIEILKGLRDKYEAHHKIRIPDSAIEAAVELSGKFITNRLQPDKAIDVMDEAAATMQVESGEDPPEITKWNNKIKQLEAEKQSAIANTDYEQAAEFRDQIEQTKSDIEKYKADNRPDQVKSLDREAVASIVSLMTGVPLKRLNKDEKTRLLNLEDELHNVVISQHEAIETVSKAIRRSRSGLKDPCRPIGSFIFAGPTGVGKTLLSKTLAKEIFGSQDALIHIDMSEYMEKHNISRLIGAPPGYIGHDEGGQLTERVRRRPYAVVVFDEIEKAHPDVFNMLLQILEEGHLTDSLGRQVEFRNTIIIMTTNIGSDMATKTPMGFKVSEDEEQTYQDMKKTLTQEIEKHFRPEFINRLDDTIVFHALTKDDMRKIVDLEATKMLDRLQSKQITAQLDQAAIEHLIKCDHKKFGARPLRRTIEQQIEDHFAEAMLQDTYQPGDHVTISAKDEELAFIKQ